MLTSEDAQSSSSVSTEIVDDIGEIDPALWDRLVGVDNFFTSHRWLRSIQLAHGNHPVVAAFDGGELLGALPTWPGEPDGDRLFSIADLAPGLDTGAGNYLWLGTRRSVCNELVCLRGQRRRAVLNALINGAVELAARQGAAGVVMPYLASADALELAAAHPRARALLHSADAYLPVPPGGLTKLQTHGDKRHRQRFRVEQQTFQRTGAAVKTTVLTEDIADRVASLIAQNRSRHGSPGGADLIRRILLAQRTTGLLDDAVVFLALRDRDLIAVLIAYPRGDRLYARYFGFDYAAATPACEYFVLSFHVAVDYAARAGFRRYRLSIEAWDTKIRHGAHLTPLAAVILPTRGVICTPAHQRELNIAAARRWRDRTRTRPQALDPEWDHWDSLAR